ncbi:hypothetical protein EJ02DRAFT_85322 [Clathrospora elynae]|uniref:Uncharacterized protein n=1 Tax=Clathrospora elynae TaxID=706981 RepID=A0A6A5SY81_9PLEO|nr:hypothetical protein EJ02DRAFT_85322 [Clathrospora elynae]
MATYHPHSHSPRVSERASPRIHPGNPMTPVHSPHHSVTSSISSRTPIHTLTIHEYRKQQHTPSSQTGPPNGKTLRRKAAASTLNDLERTPSVTHSTRSGSGSSLRPLHFSQSAHQLKSNQLSFQQQTLLELSFRSQSAEPRVQTGSISSISTTNSSGKVRHFNSRKRLPKPPVAIGPIQSPPALANLKSTQSWHSPPPAAWSFSTEPSHPSDAQTTPTPSTFSLSRFPQPPRLIDRSLSPPRDEREPARINALSFTTTAPATPPATPAIIHYRGASFNLVNPHDSLLLHEIVTPSRDFDSSDYLPLRTSEEFFIVSEEMARKRAVYGDFRAAHAGIRRRAEDSLDGSNLDLPLPPTPAAVSPNSSSYASPTYSPESINSPSPLAIQKPTNDSRFSLKSLTRSLTKKLGKSPVKIDGEELQDMRDRSVSMASISMDGDYPRPLTRTYVATPQASYFPVSSMSPTTPTSPTASEEIAAFSPGQNEVEHPRRHTTNLYEENPLASMVPDYPSTQVGRLDDSQLPKSDEGGVSKPYYEDLDSLYASSSIYTADGRHTSNYQQSLSSNRQSHPFARYSGMDASSFANEYNRDSLYGYSSSNRVSRQASHPFTQEMYHRSVDQTDPKTDTISKLIDEYNPEEMATMPMPTRGEQAIDAHGLVASDSGTFGKTSKIDRPQPARVSPGLGRFELDLRQDAQKHHDRVAPIQRVFARLPTITQHPGSPPRQAAPLAPAFEYDEAPFIPPRSEMSGMFSKGSSCSYGDTRNLLQIPPSEGSAPSVPVLGLEPSSSYSQPGDKSLEPSSPYSQAESPQTPKAALDQAEQIFHDTVTKHQQSNSKIPAMWARHNSGSQLLSKTVSNRSSGNVLDPNSLAVHGDGVAMQEKADWETIGGNSQGGHESLGSIADYSSSEGTRNSLGLNSDGSLPLWAKQTPPRGPSTYYSHPSPIHIHPHPFSSSPPDLKARASVRTAPGASSPPQASSPPASKTAPLFPLSAHPEDVLGRGAVEQPYAFAPWADPYAFSDKETQELLASGPNDDVIIDAEPNAPKSRASVDYEHQGRGMVPMTSSDESVFEKSTRLERENTFEKLCVVGPRGNLTGTPRGTGMHETGSSVADTSSPGIRLSSSVGRQSPRSDYTGFYASPFPAAGSVTRIRQSRPARIPEPERTSSESTLFPRSQGLDPVQETSQLPGAGHRQHLRNSTTFQRAARRTSRTAVPGQTKLRHMFLAPEGRSNVSSEGTHISHFMGGSGRPSTSDTNTPLRPSQLSIDTYPATARTVIAHEHSPHLLCVEREANPEDEARRRRLSWFILAAFCILPPCIILFRFMGDSVIASLTKGRLGHCTPESKRTALIAGIAVNVGLVTAILVPILIAHALKAV